MIKKLMPFLAVIFIFSLAVFTACTEEKEKLVEIMVHDTLYVNVEIIPVIIDDIEINPEMISVGQSITLTTNITKESYVGDLIFTWRANGGTFNANVGDTVTWKSPDEAGTYTVSVTADDGAAYSGFGKRNIGVGMYAATADTYYVGAMNCVGCHSGIRTEWAETGHAHAWASLQTSDHAASYCNPCHTVDFDQVPGNAGYDDAPIAKFENVQCENCHGPSSFHPGSEGNPSISYKEDNCITCHSGDHHPFEADWNASRHGVASTNHGSENSRCQPCHSASGFIAAYGGGVEFNSDDPGDITCSACHDPHSAAIPYQVRTIADVTSVEANRQTAVIKVSGNGQLCVQCHKARRSADTEIEEGYEHFGPHASPQGDMVYGVSGYEFYDVQFEGSFGGENTGHAVIEDACVTCHMYATPYPNANTGHTFKANPAACAKCHGIIDDFDDIQANHDFDGDGAVEGLQSEVTGLMTNIEVLLVAAGLDTVGHADIVEALGATMNDTLATGEPDPAAQELRRGGYNYAFVYDDKSLGIHNPTYTIQLLLYSQDYLEGLINGKGKSIRETPMLSAHEKAIVPF